MKIYITGVAGTGKTSIARALKEKGISAIDLDTISHMENKTTGEIVHWNPGASDEWIQAHDWVCDIPKLKDFLSISENSVVVGHTANQKDYLSLFDKIFVLSCRPETITQRIQNRTDNDFGKHPEDLARILNWNKEFTGWMLELGAEVLDGEKPLNEIVKHLISLLK